MTSTKKIKQHQLVKFLQERQSSHEIQQMLELLGLLLEEAKDSLVSCAPTEFARLQGVAQTYEGLNRLLTRPNPNQTTQPKDMTYGA